MFIVFDLDDTLANNAHRHHILEEEHESDEAKWNAFFDACGDDEVNPMITLLLDQLAHWALAHFGVKNRVEIWTGRSERVRGKTESWLKGCVANYARINAIRMRAEGDFRPDTEVKAEWMEKYGKPDLVFDDRNSVVKWWREQGVTCCQVKESDY